jgi:tRNA-dihydrouridine synthase
MEGLTDSIYRRLHHKHFGGVDAYFMPFLSPTQHRVLTHREERELPLADSLELYAVPQVLTKNAQDFLWAAQVCAHRGYDQVNLNIGCPSGTVVSKGKGSGMLRNPEELDAFLEEIFSASPIPISVKTRLGLKDPEEFPRLLEILNRYPIRELTVHPRVREDFYKGSVRKEWFAYALEHSKNPLCCNGDILTRQEADAVSGVEAVMIGRALIADPGLLSGGSTRQQLKAFLEELLEEYTEAFGSYRNAMFRMKENWGFLRCRFEGSDKLWKQLRKTTDPSEYRNLTAQILDTLPLAENPAPLWQK